MGYKIKDTKICNMIQLPFIHIKTFCFFLTNVCPSQKINMENPLTELVVFNLIDVIATVIDITTADHWKDPVYTHVEVIPPDFTARPHILQ